MLSFGVLPRRRCFSAYPFRRISTILSNVARFTPVILRNFVSEYSAIFSYFIPLFYRTILFSQEVYYKYDEARTYCEQILRWLTDNNPKLPSLSLLFHQDYLQISRDQNFIIELLGKRCGGIIVKDILYYLKTNNVDSKDYAKILFAACKTLSEQETRSMSYHVNDLIFCVAQLFRLGKDDKDVLNQCLDIWDEVYHTYPLSVQPLADLLEQR